MKKILIIDDDPQIRELLVRLMTLHGFIPLTAANGEEGLQLFRRERPDLVISDLIMPEKEGYETLRTIKTEQPGTGVFIISGGGRMDAQSALSLAKQFGADRTFSKPFSCAELIAAVRERLA